MVYCTKCGAQNQPEAQFCLSCGASLTGPPAAARRDWENECERECEKGPRGGSVIWGIIIILVGIYVLWEFGLKNVQGLPQWVYDFQFWWVIPVLIGIAIIVGGLRLAMRKR